MKRLLIVLISCLATFLTPVQADATSDAVVEQLQHDALSSDLSWWILNLIDNHSH